MALQMAYTDPDGGHHPDSYWVPVEFGLRKLKLRTHAGLPPGVVVFRGYHDAAYRREHCQYPVSTEVRVPLDADQVASILGGKSNPSEIAYTAAKALPFFANAKDV
jgi:hypothetical protein